MKSIRAITGDPIILICLGIGIFPGLKGIAHGAEWMVNLDISKSVKAKDYGGKETEFKKNVQTVEDIIRNKLAPGDSITVVGITEDSFSRPYILLSHKLTDKKGAFGENLAKDKLSLIKKWQGLDLKPIAKGNRHFRSDFFVSDEAW